jgi:hypothetical protein
MNSIVFYMGSDKNGYLNDIIGVLFTWTVNQFEQVVLGDPQPFAQR